MKTNEEYELEKGNSVLCATPDCGVKIKKGDSYFIDEVKFMYCSKECEEKFRTHGTAKPGLKEG